MTETQTAAQEVPPKADVLITLAWRSMIEAVRKMPGLFVVAGVWMALIAIGDLIGGHMLAHFLPALGNRMGAMLVMMWGLLSVVLEALVLAPVAVAVHRLVLLKEISGGWRTRVWRFFGWSLVITMLTAIIASPIVLSDGYRGEWLAWIVFGPAAAVVTVRLLLLFPAVAVDASSDNWQDRLHSSWHQTRGHFWRLALAVAGAVALFVVPIMLLLGAATFATAFAGSIEFAGSFLVIEQVFLAAIRPITIALIAAVASWVYLWVLEHREFPAAGAQPVVSKPTSVP